MGAIAFLSQVQFFTFPFYVKFITVDFLSRWPIIADVICGCVYVCMYVWMDKETKKNYINLVVDNARECYVDLILSRAYFNKSNYVSTTCFVISLIYWFVRTSE